MEKLALELINPGIKSKMEKMASKNYSGCHSPLLNSIRKTGISLINKVSNQNAQNENSTLKLEKKQRCVFCTKRENQTKYKEICCECEVSVCPTHSFKYCVECKKTVKN